ncbi:helix-turn-helix domain-containing protein [Deinococcus hopiensis]|uniref:DNA binding domain-containing protein, excisionase family n=1 Tax=Deinococcus hopiensis KR-140 TaxID=695939 RepID=A0A1W1UJP5_9DEIO|nr:helix-turn-helix domain-containing protein [Deinococcus hopiensis]SMB81269.1 DNA binding domain-containing protein, excisionase family [Deinococcus hopiensis KR-140]
MTAQHEPRGLLTVPEAARLLHVSDDTVRRQIREGDLGAVRIGTTPTGRPRYRIPAAVVEARLGRSTLQAPSAAERLQAAFAVLTEDQQEALLTQAINWARAQAPEVVVGERQPEPTAGDIAVRFPGLAPRQTRTD